jgi:acetolactate synthase-1/3 small subunit
MPLENEKTKVIAALVEDKPGVLHSVSNLFRRRAFNIGSLTVGPAETKGLSRMTISVKGDEKTIDQVVLQLNKLVEVVKVCKLDPDNIVTRELALAKVKVPDARTRSDVINCVDVFRAHVVDVSPESLTVEITGGPDKIDAFLNLMRPFGIIELARTGLTALSRGSNAIGTDE